MMNIPGNNDITVIQISTTGGHITVVNISNDCTHSRMLVKLKQFMWQEQHHILVDDRDMILWGGDFNDTTPMGQQRG